MADARKKGLDSTILSKDVLEKHKHLTNKQIAIILKSSIYIVKKSLCHHGLYTGKVYEIECEACGSIFNDFVNIKKYCSNHCKHNKQAIWNRGLTKKESSILASFSKRMMNNTHGSSVKHENICIGKIELPNLGIVEYDTRSSLEKEWLIQIDKDTNVESVKKNIIKIPYKDTIGKWRNYLPDFQVKWKNGTRWLVEIKGIMTDMDHVKVAYAEDFCKKNRMRYRIITTGMVKKALWHRVYCQYKATLIPSVETIMMTWAVSTSLLSPSNRRKVGAIICDSGMNNILSIGYNGDESGGANVAISEEPGKDGFIHAEENALIKLASDKPAVMFLTDSPCAHCAKRIIQKKNIKEIYYLRQYRDIEGIGILASAGVKVYRYEIINDHGVAHNAEDAYLMLCPVGIIEPVDRKKVESMLWTKTNFNLQKQFTFNKTTTTRRPYFYNKINKKKRIMSYQRFVAYTSN